MKTSNLTTTILVGLTLLLAVPQDGQAQKRYAAFIHGITFGDSRPKGVKDNERCIRRPDVKVIYRAENPFRQDTCNEEWKDGGSRLKESGTPRRWKGANLINDYIRLRYFDRDLYDDAGGNDRDVTVDDTREDMMQRFVHHMQYKGPDAEWVLVGHSQGGIVARLLHEYIRRNNVDLNVEGVLAVASPMQGAKPATVSYGSHYGYQNIKSTVNGFIEDLIVGPIEAGFFSGAIANVATYVASFRLDDKINSMAVRKDAEEAIGPHGELIRKINRSPNPDAYRALLGAERGPVPFRLMSGGTTSKTPQRPLTGNGNPFLITDLDKKFDIVANILDKEDIPKFSAGEEPKTVKFYRKLKMKYKAKEDKERDGACTTVWGVDLVCEPWDLAESKQWRQGRRALENIDETHTEIINSYRLREKSREVLVCPGNSGSDDGNYDVSGRRGFSPPSAREHVNPRLPETEGECYWKTEYYYLTVPNKNDGLLGTMTTTWNRSYAGDPPNLGPHSILYNDRPSSNQYKQGGTGYNHAEMVYDKRRYNSSADPGIGGGNDPSFSEGQRNPPMRGAERWVQLNVFGGAQ